MAEYVQKENTLQITFQEENINTKFPTLKASIMSGGQEFAIAAWVREGKYGKSFSISNLNEASNFLRVLLGSRPSEEVKAQEEPYNRKAEAFAGRGKQDNVSSLVR